MHVKISFLNFLINKYRIVDMEKQKLYKYCNLEMLKMFKQPN